MDGACRVEVPLVQTKSSLPCQRASGPPGRLAKHTSLGLTPEFLTHQVWGGAWGFAILRGAQVILMLLV